MSRVSIFKGKKNTLTVISLKKTPEIQIEGNMIQEMGKKNG